MVFNCRCSVTPSLQLLLFITSQCDIQQMTARLIRVDDFAMQNAHIQIWDGALGHSTRNIDTFYILSIRVFKMDKFLIKEVIIEPQCGALVLTSAVIYTTTGRSKNQ